MTDKLIEEHAQKMSDALRKIRPLGGSEMFVRLGEKFYADPVYCGNLIDHTLHQLHEARCDNVKLARERDSLGGQLATIRAETVEAAAKVVESMGHVPNDHIVQPDWSVFEDCRDKAAASIRSLQHAEPQQ